jgi:hypothetical protein
MTVPLQSQQPPEVQESIFARLATRDIDLLIALIHAGWRLGHAVYPRDDGLWQDFRDLLADLHRAWCTAFERENGYWPVLADAASAALR